MRISDWSSDVCSSDLIVLRQRTAPTQLVEYPTKTIAERIEHHHLIWTERPGKLRHPAKRQNRRRAKPRRPASIRRSEERRVGKEWDRRCRSRWSPYP